MKKAIDYKISGSGNCREIELYLERGVCHKARNFTRENGYIVIHIDDILISDALNVYVDEQYDIDLKNFLDYIEREDGTLALYDPQDYGYCEDCGAIICYNDEDYIYMDGYTGGLSKLVCSECIGNYAQCDRCELWVRADDLHRVSTVDDNSERWCDHCVIHAAHVCPECGTVMSNELYDLISKEI